MPRKNKGNFGKGKTQVEEQDEFVSGVQRFAAKLSPYKWRLLTFAGIVILEDYEHARKRGAAFGFQRVLLINLRYVLPASQNAKCHHWNWRE